jgi:hypothetical protein
MATMKSIQMVLMENHPDGIYNEQDVWEAIAESQGLDYSEIADGDLAEWL